MVAALVLLNGLVALGAVLRVGHDPRDVLALSRVLQVPLLGVLTVARFMGFLPALETERIATLAVDLHDPSIFVDHTVVTAGKRTPPNLLVIVGVGLAEPLLVSFEVCTCKIFHKHRVRHRHIALMLRAGCRYAELKSLIYTRTQVISPVSTAKLMPTLQGVCLCSGSIELRVAYLAVALVR